MSHTCARYGQASAGHVFLFRFLSVLVLGMLASCASPQTTAPVPHISGLNLVAPLGSPPADFVAWSPATDELLIAAGDVGTGRAEVYTLNLTTGKREQVMVSSYGDVVGARWSPDASRILVVAREHTIATGKAGLWIFDRKHGQPTYLANTGMADWSASTNMIATMMTEGAGGQSRSVVVDLIDPETGKIDRVYDDRQAKAFSGPSWSTDGKTIALGLGTEHLGDLYLFDTQTRQIKRLTNGARASGPSMSPRDGTIAYTRWPAAGDATTLHLLDSTGQCDRELAGISNAWSPTWSPDGKKLAFVGADGVYVLDFDNPIWRSMLTGGC